MKRILLLAVAFTSSFSSMFGQLSTCTESASASGPDDAATTATVNTFTCVPGGNVIYSATLDGSIGGNCTFWYAYDIVVNGTTIATGQCDQTGFDLTPYLPLTSVSIVSEDTDVYQDIVTMNLNVNLNHYDPTVCQPAMNLTALVEDNDSLTFQWDELMAPGNGWIVEYGPTGFTPGSGTYQNAAYSGDTIGGLDQLTAYDIYVYADCGADTSVVEGPITMTTLANCPSVSGITAVAISPDSIDLAWTPGVGGETEWIIEYGMTGFAQGTGTTIVVNNPYDTIEPLTQNTAYDFYVSGVCSVQDTATVVGPVSATTPLYCNNPGTLGATTVMDTAFISWIAGPDGETEWNVEWGPQGFDLGTGTMYTTTNNTNDTITGGLLPSAFYEFYVQAACAGGDTSLFVGPFSFAMPLGNDDACDALELPVDGVSRNFFTTGATSQGEPISGSGGASTWFYFIPSNGFGTTISLCGSGYDTKVYGFSYTDCGDFNTYTQLGYNDDFCGLQSQIEVCGEAGDTIMVMVDGFSGASGNFTITLTGNNFDAGTGSIADVCTGDTLDLWTALSGQAANTGYWDYPNNPNAVIDDSLAVSGNITAGGSDFYYIMGNSCGADTAVVNINAVAPGNTGTAVDPFTSCNSDVFLPDGLTGVVEAGGTWADDSGTGLLAGPSGNVFVAHDAPAGTYPFTYTVDNGVCPPASTTVEVVITDCSDITENHANATIYPNPNNGNFAILSDNSGESNVIITDISGKVVFNNVVVFTAGTPVEVSLNNLEAGMYMVNIATATGSKVMNMVIK